MEYIVFISTLLTVLFFLWTFVFNLQKKMPVMTLCEPATFSLIILCITGWIGSITIFLFRDGHYFNKVVNNYDKNDFFILMLVTLLVFFMSIVSKLNIRFLSKVNLPCSTKIKKIDWAILFVIALFFMWYIFKDIRFLLGLFSATDQYQIMALRKESTSAGGDYLFKKVILESLFWVLILYYYSFSKRELKFSIALYITTFLFSLYFLLSLKKISIVILLLSIFLAVNHSRKIGFFSILKLVIYFFAFMFVIYALLIKNVDLYYMLSPFNEGLVGRVFISEISSLYAHIEIFKFTEIGWGSISQSLSNLFNIEFTKRSGQIVMETVNPSWVELGIGGTYNTLFLGEAFANFSYFGLWLSILYVPLYYLVIVRCILFFPAKIRVAVLVFLSMNISIMSGFNDYIYNPFLILLFVLLLFRRLIPSAHN